MATSDAAAITESLTDPAAFAVIFDRHASSLHRYLTRRLQPAEADSLLGEVFRIAFERRTSYDTSHESARPWLYGIATNLIARHRRSEGRRMRAMAVLASRSTLRIDDVVGDQAAQSVDAQDTWSRLVDAIDMLPVVERDTLLLYVWEDLSYADIAAALDIPVGTVRSRLNRARRRLREGHDANTHRQPTSPLVRTRPTETPPS